MTAPLIPSRDQQALDAATASSLLFVPSRGSVGELSPAQAVRVSLARHLARLEAEIDGMPPQGLKFAGVKHEWPGSTEGAVYPSAVVLPVSTTEWDSYQMTPYPDPKNSMQDAISHDGLWALWVLGEDIGEGVVHVFAETKPARTALTQAVEQALLASLDGSRSLVLPLPELFLPPPFRGWFDPSQFPRARVFMKPGGGEVDEAQNAERGPWRGDAHFTWQAPRFAARPRIADLREETYYHVKSAQETLDMPAIRRYFSAPSAAELTKVSGVVILNLPSQAPVRAAQFGKVCLVGEFEDGPFATPTDLLQSTDQANIFGLFGYQYGTQKYQYACAKQSGGTEYWNGNGYVQSARLVFGGLSFCRVDTSIGSVNLIPRSYIQSTSKAPFNVTPGFTLIYTLNGGAPTTVTFNGTSASVLGVGATYPTADLSLNPPFVFSVDGGSSVSVVFSPGTTALASVVTQINAAYGGTIASTSGGQFKLTSLTSGTGSSVSVTAGTTTTALGLPTTTATGTGDAANLAAMTYAEFSTKVTGGGLVTSISPVGSFPRLVSSTAGTGTLSIGAGTANAALGFVNGTASTAATAALVTIPAGTRISNAGATRVVTMQSVTLPAGSTGLTTLRVRPAVDDGSYPGVAASTLVTLEDQPGGYEWSVTQPSLLTAALTAAQLDTQYLAAIASTIGVGNSTTKKISGIVSARQSNAIRAALQANEITATANGHADRRAFVSAPNGTSAQNIIGGQSYSVTSYRDEGVAYCAGGVQCQLQEMVDGGYQATFNAVTGNVIRHFDTMLASRWSALTPGYNPGQYPEDPNLRWDVTTFPGLEPAAQGWDINAYANFKTFGVCAAEFDKDTGILAEEGVTAVDPNVDPTHTDISRRTLEGFISDSISMFVKAQAKRQGTQTRRESNQDSIARFLDSLIGSTIQQYSLSITTQGLPTHVVRYNLAVIPIQSDDVIVLSMNVSPNAVLISKS